MRWQREKFRSQSHSNKSSKKITDLDTLQLTSRDLVCRARTILYARLKSIMEIKRLHLEVSLRVVCIMTQLSWFSVKMVEDWQCHRKVTKEVRQ
jgi:hypothetical protein